MFRVCNKNKFPVALMMILATNVLWGQTWLPEGPGPNKNGQTENVTPDNEVAGAVEVIEAHPTNPDVLWAGSVNGGVWYTENATAERPTWTNQTLASLPGLRSLSIGALDLDVSDTNYNRLVAGIGLFSSFGRVGGDRIGLIGTTDGGQTWTKLQGKGLNAPNISGVVVRGDTIVISVNSSDTFATDTIGIFRSSNFGASFDQVSLGDGGTTGLPSGFSTDLFGDPVNHNIVYTVILGSNRGIFRSDNLGASWAKVSTQAIDSQLQSANNVELAVGHENNVYVAITSGALTGLHRSGNSGSTWSSLDLPSPTIHPGGQSGIHLSIAADSSNPNVVYIGGDRQDDPFPNGLGANNYSGNLWRVNAFLPPGSQAQHLTHSNSMGPSGGGTANSSSPHADSRDMAIDANGNLIESDDGGVYRRTSPLDNTGDWFSINGNMQSAEFHGIDYDGVSKVILGGTQDTGTGFQDVPMELPFTSISTADGGDATVDDVGSDTSSVRYSSFQFLFSFRRTVWDAQNNFISRSFPSLNPINGSPAIDAAFYSAIQANNVAGLRLVLHVSNGLFESLDEGQTVELVTNLSHPGSGTSAIDYGAADNADIIYVGGFSGRVEIRTGAPGTATTVAAAFPGDSANGTVRSIAINPDLSSQAVAVNSQAVYFTSNTGGAWEEITGNLSTFDLGSIQSVEYVNREAGDRIVVGARRGIYQALESDGFSVWAPLNDGLPNAPVLEIIYNANDDILVAGLLGFGAWTLELNDPVEPVCTGDFNLDEVVDQADLNLIYDGWDNGNLDFDTNADEKLDMRDIVVTINVQGACPLPPNTAAKL